MMYILIGFVVYICDWVRLTAKGEMAYAPGLLEHFKSSLIVIFLWPLVVRLGFAVDIEE